MNRHRVRSLRATRPRGGRVVLAGATVLCAMAALPGPAWAAGTPAPYRFQPDARPVTGAATTTGAGRLDAGATYRDSIGPGEKRFYRVDLDAKKNAYVSAVAVPGPGTTVAYGDRLKVSLQNRGGSDCSSNEARFGPAAFPRPLAAYAYRVIDPGAYACQQPGPYYVMVERTGEATSTPARWDLEIRHVSEPGLSGTGPGKAPENWPSASPAPLGADPRQRDGGTGFSDARGLTKGEWTTQIEPGESLFYRVPVDWGQQLFSSADLGSSEGSGSVSGAFSLALYNPARGLVSSGNSVSYDGRQKTTSLGPLPPVAYENRFASASGDKDMRFAGWYYLRVSLSPEVAAKFGARPHGLTLQVNVTGKAHGGPGYAGPPGEFTVTEADRNAASTGNRNSVAANATMRMVAVAGIGAGTVLVLGLGTWTLLARRRLVRGQGRSGVAQEPAGQYGPPAA